MQRSVEKCRTLKKEYRTRYKHEFPKLSVRLRKFCFFLLCLFPFAAGAQQIRRDSVPARPRPAAPVVPDSLKPLTYILANQPEKVYPGPDTMPDFQFRMYDPARRQAIDWGTLGSLATPARPLWFAVPARKGFDPGIHNFDLYRLNASDLRIYQNTRSYSEVFFSQGQSQDNLMFSAQMARTFSGGSTFSFDYRSYNNLGQFRYQQAQHNSLAAGMRVPVGKRYEGYIVFCQNVFRQKDNGGIVTDTIFGKGQFQRTIDAEIRLPGESAQTRVSDRTLQLTQHFRFAGEDTGKRAYRATHSIAWTKSFWKFSDTEVDANQDFYGPFFITETRGLRDHIRLNRLDNSFTISTFKQKKAGQPSDLLAFGLTHSWFDLYQEPLDSSFSNLFLNARIGITPSERFALTAQGDLGMLNNFGEYQLSGALSLSLGKAGRISASVLSQRRPPSLLQYRNWVSFRELWRNDNLKKPLENALSFTYALPLAGLELTGQTHVISNYIYFDQDAKPVQTTSPLQVGQLLISENLHVGRLHFDNTLGLQQLNRSDVVRLPSWFSKNSLYYSGKVFKKNMDLSAGADFRINSEFRPDAYMPLTGQFHLQDSLTQKPYPWVDLFVAFKVRSFRFFFRYENLTAIWKPENVFYQTAYHPQNFNTLRFGIRWRFMDSNLPDANQNGNKPSDTAPGSIGPKGF